MKVLTTSICGRENEIKVGSHCTPGYSRGRAGRGRGGHTGTSPQRSPSWARPARQELPVLWAGQMPSGHGDGDTCRKESCAFAPLASQYLHLSVLCYSTSVALNLFYGPNTPEGHDVPLGQALRAAACCIPGGGAPCTGPAPSRPASAHSTVIWDASTLLPPRSPHTHQWRLRLRKPSLDPQAWPLGRFRGRARLCFVSTL